MRGRRRPWSKTQIHRFWHPKAVRMRPVHRAQSDLGPLNSPPAGTLRLLRGLRDMGMVQSSLLILALALFPGLALPLSLSEPGRPIVLINSFPPNGPADLVGRSITGRMLKLMTTFGSPAVTDVLASRTGHAVGLVLDRAVKVDRRARGRGIPGTGYVAKSIPDGHTLLFVNNVELLVQPKLYRLPYRPDRDLKPIAAVARMPIAMIALTRGGPASVQDFIVAARASPEKLNYASSGEFRSGHLAGELFATRAGLSLVHVPYNGGNEALNGLLRGQIPVAFVPLPSVLPAIPGGKIRIIGIADAARIETLPHVPTISESGVSGFEAASWYGVYAPAGILPDEMSILNDAIVTGLRANLTERYLASQGLQARYPGSREYGQLMSAEEKKWAPILERMSPPY